MINIQNMSNNNKCFKWCIDRYLHLADYHPARIIKIDEILADELDFEEIKLLVKTKDIRKIKKIKSISISVLSYENKKKSSLYIKTMV